jgi:hypothetical protein
VTSLTIHADIAGVTPVDDSPADPVCPWCDEPVRPDETFDPINHGADRMGRDAENHRSSLMSGNGLIAFYALDPEFRLASGEHAGFTWIVTHNGSGRRCGYVRLLPGHPWYGLERHEVRSLVRVHGGITWKETLPCGECYIGFDTGHTRDLPDPELPVHPAVRMANELMAEFLGGRSEPDVRKSEIRTQEYVEAECRSLCEQAAAARKGGE